MNGRIVEGINNGQYPTVHCVIIISIYIINNNIFNNYYYSILLFWIYIYF